jgi:hypothetical protein
MAFLDTDSGVSNVPFAHFGVAALLEGAAALRPEAAYT